MQPSAKLIFKAGVGNGHAVGLYQVKYRLLSGEKVHARFLVALTACRGTVIAAVHGKRCVPVKHPIYL